MSSAGCSLRAFSNALDRFAAIWRAGSALALIDSFPLRILLHVVPLCT